MSAHLEKAIMFMIQTYLNSEIVTRGQVIRVLERLTELIREEQH